MSFGNGIATTPINVDVPIFTERSITLSLAHPIEIPLPGGLSPIKITTLPTFKWYFPDLPPFTNFGESGTGILGIGPNALGPNITPVTASLPGQLNQGVLINATSPTAGYLEFGPNPLTPIPGASVPGAPTDHRGGIGQWWSAATRYHGDRFGWSVRSNPGSHLRRRHHPDHHRPLLVRPSHARRNNYLGLHQ